MRDNLQSVATVHAAMTDRPPHRCSHRPRHRPLAALLLAALLAGCHPGPEEEPATEAKAAAEQAAAKASDELDELPSEAAAQKEAARLGALWTYLSTPIEGQARPQKSASMRNLRPEEDDAGSFEVVPTVQLVLRNDPRWGQSVYLVIEEGHFGCGRPCAFSISFDGALSQRFGGKASSTGTRPALFIEDDAAFIRALDAAGTIDITPVDGRSAPIRFETRGFDPMRYETGA